MSGMSGTTDPSSPRLPRGSHEADPTAVRGSEDASVVGASTRSPTALAWGANPGANKGRDESYSEASTSAGRHDAASRFVVVPRMPGRLVDLGAGKGRQRDELDEFIDDVLGQSTKERPGVFDAVLVLAGLVLLGWGVFLGGPDISRWLGAFAVLLGVALPLRGAIRGYSDRRSRAARKRAIGDGLVLDISNPATADLAEAYDRLLDIVRLPSVREPSRITAAGHMAVIEVASLLHGEGPVAIEQVVYVGRRTQAISALSTELLQAHEAWLATSRAEMEARASESRGWAGAVAAAREELEATLRTGSLSELDLLSDAARRDAADADA